MYLVTVCFMHSLCVHGPYVLYVPYIPRVTHVPRMPRVLYGAQVSYVTLPHVTYVMYVQHLTVITFNVRLVFYVQQMCRMKSVGHLHCMYCMGV